MLSEEEREERKIAAARRKAVHRAQLHLDPNSLQARVRDCFDKAGDLREKRIEDNLDMASVLGMSERSFERCVREELSTPYFFYYKALLDQADYEDKNKRAHPYRTMSVPEYLAIFDNAGDDFDLLISRAYNDPKIQNYGLDGLVRLVKESIEARTKNQQK